MKLKKWEFVYPHGTKEGDEELAFFIALARTRYQWRSTSALARESNLSRERVEEIIQKYYKKGMVFQNPKNEDQWGYWERVPEMLPESKKSISQKDHEDRINKLTSKCLSLSFDLSSVNCQIDAKYNNVNLDIFPSTNFIIDANICNQYEKLFVEYLTNVDINKDLFNSLE
jgi:hypothetical protein